MPRFRYVVTPQGEPDPSRVRGQAEAESADILRGRLEEVGFRVEEIEEEGATAQPQTGAAPPAPPGESLEGLVAMVHEVPIVRIVQSLIEQAIREGASDIHIEPRNQGGAARYRIDGVLHDVVKLPAHVVSPVISRIKLMAEMELHERRLPQKGRIPVTLEERDYDLRVATLPTTLGENVVLRIVDHSLAAAWTWEGLGFRDVEAMRALLGRPQGLILFAGPSASGKTTVLYSALNSLDAERLNIVTVDDPYFFRIEGINHSQANLPIEQALQALAERDPDVIAIGEVREPAEIAAALEAAVTGHLVLTTFYANDAAHAIERLIGLGLSPAQLSAALAGIVASRIVRWVCLNCREAYQPREELLRALGITSEQAAAATFYRGAGCDTCRGTGYRGRTGIFDLLAIDAGVASLIAAGATGEPLRRQLAQSGLHTFREDGARKVLEGVTTAEELVRVTGDV